MDFETLAWIFAGAVSLHNLEEALLSPDWSRSAGRWRVPAGDFEFRFAVLVLAVLAFACAWATSIHNAVGAYAICGYALAMLINAFVPHAAATLILQRYTPGTATALCLILPSAILLLRQALIEQRIELSLFLWTGPLTSLALAFSIPVLFNIGRWLQRGRN
jgi:hypothetical protein